MNIGPTVPKEAEGYLTVWRLVLCHWLHWPEERIGKFIERWQRWMFGEPGGFYNELPFHYLTQVLMSPDMRRRYKGGERISIQSDVEGAVIAGDCFAHLRPDYDWDAARVRVEQVLARYNGALPRPEDLAWYEEGKTV